MKDKAHYPIKYFLGGDMFLETHFLFGFTDAVDCLLVIDTIMMICYYGYLPGPLSA